MSSRSSSPVEDQDYPSVTPLSVVENYIKPEEDDSERKIKEYTHVVIETGYTSRLVPQISKLIHELSSMEISVKVDFIFDDVRRNGEGLFVTNIETGVELANKILKHTSSGVIVISAITNCFICDEWLVEPITLSCCGQRICSSECCVNTETTECKCGENIKPNDFYLDKDYSSKITEGTAFRILKEVTAMNYCNNFGLCDTEVVENDEILILTCDTESG